MKAAVFRGIEDIKIEDIPKPKITKDEILLKVNACAICGTDVRIFKSGHKNINPPHVLGHEICGTVVKTGSNISGYKEGERVVVDPIITCGKCYYCKKGLTNLCFEFQKITDAFGYSRQGGFAEYMAIHEKAVKRGNLIKINDNIKDEEAAISEPMACALNGQLLSNVGKGDSVLIIGTGPIGCMHIGLSKVLGADKVIISEISEERLKLSEQFNADFYINPKVEDLKTRIYEITDNIGPNVIIIAASSKEAQEGALDIAANCAHINFFGGLPKNNSLITIDSNIIHYKQLYIHGTSGTTNENIKRCLELMSENKMIGEKYISRVISLDEMPDIMNEMGNPNELKIVVKP